MVQVNANRFLVQRSPLNASSGYVEDEDSPVSSLTNMGLGAIAGLSGLRAIAGLCGLGASAGRVLTVAGAGAGG